MKDVLQYIIESLVDNPDEIRIDEVDSDNEKTFEVRVAKSDMGKVIGRNGRIAKEIRTLMRTAANRSGHKLNVEILD